MVEISLDVLSKKKKSFEGNVIEENPNS